MALVHLEDKNLKIIKNLTYFDEKVLLAVKMCKNQSIDGRIREIGFQISILC